MSKPSGNGAHAPSKPAAVASLMSAYCLDLSKTPDPDARTVGYNVLLLLCLVPVVEEIKMSLSVKIFPFFLSHTSAENSPPTRHSKEEKREKEREAQYFFSLSSSSSSSSSSRLYQKTESKKRGRTKDARVWKERRRNGKEKKIKREMTIQTSNLFFFFHFFSSSSSSGDECALKRDMKEE